MRIRYKTKEDKVSYQGYAGISGEIVVDPELSTARKGFVLSHEIGHKKYPGTFRRPSLEEQKKLSDEEYIQLNVDTDIEGFLGELCADYYVLRVSKNTYNVREAKKHLRWIKKSFSHQLTSEMIERLDRVARRRVGYVGPGV